MKEGWEVMQLGDIVDILDNLRKPITKRDRIEGDYPYYGATGILSYIQDYIFSEKLVLIGEDGAKWESGEKSAFIADGKYWVNNHAHVVRPHPKKVTYEWIIYFLNHSDLVPYVTGMTVPKLNQKNLRKIAIPLPPLPEQQRIVSILDRAFTAIDQAKINAEKNLKNAAALFESYLQKVFKNIYWDWKTLNEISENLDSKRIPIAKNKRTSGDIPYYGASGIVDYVSDFIFYENLLCISEDGANLLARSHPIAFSVTGKTWVNNHAHILRFKSLTTQYFIEYYINSIWIDDFVSGMAQPKLNQKNLNRIPVPFPSLEEQKIILSAIKKLRIETQKLEILYQKKINALDELKKSLLQKAFEGELKLSESGLAGLKDKQDFEKNTV